MLSCVRHCVCSVPTAKRARAAGAGEQALESQVAELKEAMGGMSMQMNMLMNRIGGLQKEVKALRQELDEVKKQQE